MVEINEPGQRVPVLLFCRAPDPKAVRQLQKIASQPWVVGQVVGMPDLHLSEGVSVGTVFATERHAVPAALGGDLGCGVSGQRFRFHAPSLDRRTTGKMLAEIARVVPVGDETQKGAGLALPADLEGELSTGSLRRARERLAGRHLGTLGGGNHFLELDADASGALWLLVHTGSRGMGAAVREHHQAAAEAQSPGPLAALDAGTPEGQAYLDDMAWAQRFARANRQAILRQAIAVIAGHTGAEPDPEGHIDVHHNFLSREEHGGRSLLVHRKGAIAAFAGQKALIPGSMGTATYLVEGLGEPRSFCSCSHGAGRVLSRTEARAQITPGALEAQLRRVVFDRRRARALVEEAPSAYRDIREVLEDEADLAAPLLRMEPLGVLKG